MKNFANQFIGFLIQDKEKQKLAILNLMMAQSTLTTMQCYFANIAINFSAQERHIKLCTMETQNIERLMMCCAYYQTHPEGKYFNKYVIKDWYEMNCKNERKTVEKALSQLQTKYSIHYPDKIYTIDILRYYPIVIDDFDMLSETNLIECFIDCIPFAGAPFDYLIILSNKSGKINPTALQLPKIMFVDIKKAIESEDYSLLGNLISLYPADVTTQMLDCFIKKNNFSIKLKNNVAAFPIVDIAEELWIYSTTVKLLSKPEDADYLLAELQNIQMNITKIFHVLKNKLTSKDVNQLYYICKKVFEGNTFDDNLFNKLIESFLKKNIKY